MKLGANFIFPGLITYINRPGELYSGCRVDSVKFTKQSVSVFMHNVITNCVQREGT